MSDIVPAGCARLDKLFRSCSWTAVYDEVKPSDPLADYIFCEMEVSVEIARLGVETKTYVGALCTTCGKFIRRDS